MSRLRSLLLLAPLFVLGVSTAQAKPSAELAKLADEYWQKHLELSPTSATAIGDRRYDDRLDDNSPAGIEVERKAVEGFLARARAIDPASLDAGDRLTRSALIEELDGFLAVSSCRLHEWVVDPMNGPQVDFFNLADYTVIQTPEDARKYVKRCQAMGSYVDQHVANLRVGLSQGRTASVDAVQKTLGDLNRLADQSVDEWATLKPAQASRPKWAAADRERFAKDVRAAMEEGVRPALARYRDFLRDELLPKARPQEKAGLAALPDGVECYRTLIRSHTSLDLSPETLHRTGLEQVAAFRRDLATLGQKALGTSDVAEIQRRLRTDPAMHFASADEVQKKAEESLSRARRAIPKYFGIQPKAGCEVRVMGMHEAPNSTVAYYRQPASDGSRPGTYMINTYKPETRPRYEAEALAFHESIPGHHLQIAIAQELKGVPEFRKHQGTTAFVEGWALYTERLADEMGLYSSDIDRIGMLSYDAWRACRLVVDTGMHAMGWTRQQAIDYMVENSVLAENNIVNEVDRYLSWPGQALAYKTGQLEILRLRDDARRRLGPAFELREFHDVVLRNGAVALPVLREQVEEWVATKTRAGAQQPK